MMTNSLSADAEESSARPPRMSRGGRIAVGAATLVFLALASWIGWDQSQKPVRWRDVGYSIVSPTEASTTFEVFLYSDADATCRLRALSKTHAEVGIADVLVRRSNGAQQRFMTTLTTVEEAVTVVVAYCEAY